MLSSEAQAKESAKAEVDAATIQTLRGENSVLRQQLSEVEKERDDLRQEVDILEEELAEKEGEIDSLNADVESLGDELDELRDIIEAREDAEKPSLGEEIDLGSQPIADDGPLIEFEPDESVSEGRIRLGDDTNDATS